MKRLAMILACALVVLMVPASAIPPPPAHYVGEIVTRWDPDGIHMNLLENFEFVDSKGVEWIAPKGSRVDGASIPRIGWTIVGGPLEGKYRDASVIHDVACVEKRRPWQQVHRAFFEAMITSGVDVFKAKTMYAAVYHFGPRWGRTTKITTDMDDVARVKKALARKVLSDENVKTASFPTSTSAPANCERCEIAAPKYEVSATFSPDKPRLSQDEFAQLQSKIEQDNLSLEQIETFVPSP